MKTYTSKSNAARAAKKANGGKLTDLELKGKTGAWYYVSKKAAKKAPAKKARKAAPVRQEYDPKHGPKQGRISGYHIDEDREEKHGVTRRSTGTIGGSLWAIYDRMAAKAGGPAKLLIADVKVSPLVSEYNANKVVIEFYYWRRFNGVRGRGRKQKVDK